MALDLVGAGVLSHAHNAESIAELRENIGAEGSAVGEPDALSTHAQLLAEKRIGFLLLTVGLVLYLSGLVLRSAEGLAVMVPVAGGVVIAGLVASLVFTRVVGNRVARAGTTGAREPGRRRAARAVARLLSPTGCCGQRQHGGCAPHREHARPPGVMR